MSVSEPKETACCDAWDSGPESDAKVVQPVAEQASIYRVYGAVMRALGFDSQLLRYVRDHFAHKQSISRILDAGCGTGAAGRSFAALYPSARIWFTDINARLLQQLAESASGQSRFRFGYSNLSTPKEVSCFDGRPVKFEDGSFDIVCAGANIGYSDTAELTVRRLYELLTPGGMLLDMEMNASPIGRMISRLYGYRRVPEQLFKDVLEPLGAKVESHSVSLRYFPINLTRICIVVIKPS